jgi:hypothetical protein
MGEGHGLSALHSGHTESADVSASTPVVPEHYGHEEHVYRVLHHGHTEYADVSASTPAVVPGTMDTKSMSTVCCTMDTQSMLMSQLASGSSSGALWARRACLPCAALWTRYAASANTQAVVPGMVQSMSAVCCTMDTQRAC